MLCRRYVLRDMKYSRPHYNNVVFLHTFQLRLRLLSCWIKCLRRFVSINQQAVHMSAVSLCSYPCISGMNLTEALRLHLLTSYYCKKVSLIGINEIRHESD